MSIAAIIPEVWSALVKEELERGIPWLQVVEDLSGEIVPTGDKVHISQIITSFDTETAGQAGTTGAQPASGGPSISSYTRDAELTYGLTQAADITLDLDQAKKWAFRIDDLDALQSRPDLMQRNIARSMRAMARIVNDRIRTSFSGAAASTKRGNSPAYGTDTTYAAITLPAASRIETEASRATKADSEGALTGATYPWLFNRGVNDYFQLAQHFINQMMLAKEHADYAFWPEEGRYCMMSPQVKNRIIDYITDQKPNLGSGMIIDNAFVNGDAPGKIFGFLGLVDPGIPPMKAADVAGTVHTNLYFGLKNDGLAYAAQVQKVEALRLQNYFADALRGLYTYGSGWLLTDRAFIASTKVVA